MKNFSLTFALLIFTSVLTLAAGKVGWGNEYDKALVQAKSDSKMVLLDFTGSDFCPPCIQLDKKVFPTQLFKDYAKKNLVLVEVDFPNDDSKQTDALKANNVKLAKKYEIEGFPTFIVLNPQGQKIGLFHYIDGGPEAFIAELEKYKGK